MNKKYEVKHGQSPWNELTVYVVDMEKYKELQGTPLMVHYHDASVAHWEIKGKLSCDYYTPMAKKLCVLLNELNRG